MRKRKAKAKSTNRPKGMKPVGKNRVMTGKEDPMKPGYRSGRK